MPPSQVDRVTRLFGDWGRRPLQRPPYRLKRGRKLGANSTDILLDVVDMTYILCSMTRNGPIENSVPITRIQYHPAVHRNSGYSLQCRSEGTLRSAVHYSLSTVYSTVQYSTIIPVLALAAGPECSASGTGSSSPLAGGQRMTLVWQSQQVLYTCSATGIGTCARSSAHSSQHSTAFVVSVDISGPHA
jgi:hypothetical protein